MIHTEQSKPNPSQFRKVGIMKYVHCDFCGDLSYSDDPNICGGPFCINQHKDWKHEQIQPESRGTNMPGKKWEDTPEGKKKK
jgi:hypothetical protein